MRRWLFSVVVCSIFGAITNVAVAWGCALWSPFRPPVPLQSDAFVSKLRTRLFDPVEPGCWGGNSFVGFGTRCQVAIGYDKARQGREGTVGLLWSHEAGFPMLCLYGAEAGCFLPWTELYDQVWLVDPPSDLGQGRHLPIQPTWPGFAVNTLFYAGLLWLPFAPRVLRPYVRRRCGRCLNCGYDLRGDLAQGCPECGWRRESAS